MQFILMGFDQDAGVRLYAFRGIADGARANYTVGVELSLIPRYGIQIQELPLLCRELLERQEECEEKRTFTLTESEMRRYADVCAIARQAAVQKKKQTRRHPIDDAEEAWHPRLR